MAMAVSQWYCVELSTITYRATAADPALRAGRAALESIAGDFSNAIEGRGKWFVMPVMGYRQFPTVSNASASSGKFTELGHVKNMSLWLLTQPRCY